MAADRNLLFGILALQMDLIQRDDLIRGMNAWVLEKAKPLAQVLEELGKLKPSDRHILEPLVAHHRHVIPVRDRDQPRGRDRLHQLVRVARDLIVLADDDQHWQRHSRKRISVDSPRAASRGPTAPASRPQGRARRRAP